MLFTAPVLLSFVLAALSNQIPARTDAADDTPATPAHTGVRAIFSGLKDDILNLPSKDNLLFLGIGGGLTLAAQPFDEKLNASAIGQSDRVTRIFAPGKYWGDTPEQMAFSLGTWAIGRVLHKPKVSHLGMDLLRAQALTELMVEPVKLATRRLRPDESNHQSFPSGHAAITFAAATVLQRHLGWLQSLPAYAIASYVAAARLQENRHYLTDVVFGAAVGTIAGRTVTRHGRGNWTLVPMPVPGGVGVGVGVTRDFSEK